MPAVSTLTEMLKNASLQEITERTLMQVKEQPQNKQTREALFKLYCVDGLWNKALLQLQTLELMDDSLKQQTELFKNLIFSEMQREQILKGEREPATLSGIRPEWMDKLHQANALHYQHKTAEAEKLRQDAFLLAEESSGYGEMTGKFSWIADGDSRLGPVCEFICAGGYRWVAFSDIQQLDVRVPKDVLDLLWMPTTLKSDNIVWHGFMPARYPVNSADDQKIKLGMRTQWCELNDMLTTGQGRKMLITDQNEHAVLEIGHVTFG